MSTLSTQERRLILSRVLKMMVLFGVITILIVFFSSLTNNSNNEEQRFSSHWVLAVPVSELVPSEVKALSWSGGVVWVYTRTEDDIVSLKNSNRILRDSDSEKSDQPNDMKNKFRSADNSYFVFIPMENKRGCQVRLNDDKTIRFIEPCFGAEFDAAGRIFSNSGHKDQNNLAVPRHVVEDGILKIGVWVPK